MTQMKKYKTDEELIRGKERKFFGKISEISIMGRNQIEISGCMGLLVYRDELIEIRLCDSIFRLSGEGLTLKNYFGGRIVISGRIDKTEYFECEV